MNERILYEFFAGGGMARLGLGQNWHCAFANDFDPVKAQTYRTNWGSEHFRDGDVNGLFTADLPGVADLAWASFPCQDLSLAGNAMGIGTVDKQTRSGAFWAFWRLMGGLIGERRAPAIIVLENVYGSLTANGGYDFALICRSLALANYRFGAIMLDAAAFLPQSRPRLFVVAVRQDMLIPDDLVSTMPVDGLHPKAMSQAVEKLAEGELAQWVWWHPADPQPNRLKLDSLLDSEGAELKWHSASETRLLISRMSEVNLAKLERMKSARTLRIGTIYKRTRLEGKFRVQRAELRDDGIAGCLRTPGGGSSRQTVIFVEGERIRTRLLAAREAARLMGLPDTYQLPNRYNDAYHLAGDGVAVPVVRHLSKELIEPILEANDSRTLRQAA
jgi:DNA (cytosine-5)-methyltransferase 1